MAVAKYEIAAKAFRRCVNLDFDVSIKMILNVYLSLELQILP